MTNEPEYSPLIRISDILASDAAILLRVATPISTCQFDALCLFVSVNHAMDPPLAALVAVSLNGWKR